MSKQQRHERKKTERSRRRRLFRHPTSHIKHGAAAIAAAAVIAAGTQAYASPVRFDNPAHGEAGHFHWANTAPALFLDMTLDAASQPAGGSGSGPTSLQHVPPMYGNVSGDGQGPEVREDATGYVLVPFASGELIDSGGNWGLSAQVAEPYFGYPTLLPEGVPTYLGVSIQDNGTHYGWIGVVMTQVNYSTYELDAFAWGYETDVGVPIPAGAPEPGSLALLALGAVGVASRRHRKQR